VARKDGSIASRKFLTKPTLILLEQRVNDEDKLRKSVLGFPRGIQEINPLELFTLPEITLPLEYIVNWN